MSSLHDLPFLRIRYLVLLALLILVCGGYILVERMANDLRGNLQAVETRLARILGDWNRLHNDFARLLLTDSYVVPGIRELEEDIRRFDKKLADFTRATTEHASGSALVDAQTGLLVDALKEGREIMGRTVESYSDIVATLSPRDYRLYSTMSISSLRSLWDEAPDPPASYLRIKRVTSEFSGLDLYFSEVFEAKQDHIHSILGSEGLRIEEWTRIMQISLSVALTACAVFFVWQIMGINKNLLHLVRERTGALQDTLDRLKATQEGLLESRRQSGLASLVMGLAHEINTPLGVAITSQSAIADSLLFMKKEKENGTLTQANFDHALQKQGDLLTLSMRNLERLNEQVNYFRTLSSPRDDLVPTLSRLDRDLAPALEQMRGQAARRSLDFTWTIKEGLEVHISPRGLILIINHLFQNSLDHGFPDMHTGRITLRLFPGDPGLVMEFRDDGQGCTVEPRERLLEPFFTTARSRGHMGIGLNIVHNLVYQHFDGTFEFMDPPRGFGVRLVLGKGKGSGTGIPSTHAELSAEPRT